MSESKGASSGMKWVVVGAGACVVAVIVVVVLQQDRIAALEQAIASAAVPAPQVVAAAHTDRAEAEVAAQVVPARSAAAPDERRLAALEKRLAAVETQLIDRRARPHGAVRPRVGGVVDEVVVDDVASLREDVDTLLTGGAVDTEEGRTAVKKLMDEMQAERRQKWQRIGEQATDGILDSVAEASGMSEDARQQVGDLIAEMRDTRRAIWRKVREEDADYNDARKQMDAARDATRSSLQSVLSEDEFATFQEKWNEQADGRWRTKF